MKKKELSEFSREELVLEVKKRQQFVGFFTGMVIAMVFCGIYLTVKQGFGVFTILPLTFIPILILMRKSGRLLFD